MATGEECPPNARNCEQVNQPEVLETDPLRMLRTPRFDSSEGASTRSEPKRAGARNCEEITFLPHPQQRPLRRPQEPPVPFLIARPDVFWRGAIRKCERSSCGCIGGKGGAEPAMDTVSKGDRFRSQLRVTTLTPKHGLRTSAHRKERPNNVRWVPFQMRSWAPQKNPRPLEVARPLQPHNVASRRHNGKRRS